MADIQTSDAVCDLSIDEIEHDLSLLKHFLKKGYIGRKFNPHFARLWLSENQPALHETSIADFLIKIQKWLLHCQDPHLQAFLPERDTRRVAAFRLTRMHQQDVVRLALHHFNGGSATWAKRCATLQHHLKTAKALVIDLRNNPGGKRSHMLDLVRVISGEHNDLGPQRTLYRDSFLNPSVRELLLNNRIWRPNQAFSFPTHHHQDSIKAQVRTPKKKTTPFTGTLFFLINEKTASTAEHMIHALHYFPNRCIIGQPTMGAISYFNRGLCVLPRSKLWVTIPTACIQYHELAPHRSQKIRPHILAKTDIEINQALRKEIRQRS